MSPFGVKKFIMEKTVRKTVRVLPNRVIVIETLKTRLGHRTDSEFFNYLLQLYIERENAIMEGMGRK